MSCCGRRRMNAGLEHLPAANAHSIHENSQHPGRYIAPQSTAFEYVGNTALEAIGPITGRRYRFEGHGAQLAVDMRDASALHAIPSLRRI